MRTRPLRFLFCGLSITSSWGNGHATTYRALLSGLRSLGHEVLFLEFDKSWYAGNRDMPAPPFCQTALFSSVAEFKERFTPEIRQADVVVLGSYVPQGIEIGDWLLLNSTGVTAFYDIDTPVTLAALERGECAYLALEQIRRFDLYFSFTGGPVLELLATKYRARRARPLYCSVDLQHYFPDPTLGTKQWDLGYLGTYSEDRQPALERLLLEPARAWKEGHFAVAGPMYPASLCWGANVQRFNHLSPQEHRWFYNRQRFTLNLTRKDMTRAGYSPSVRLFEAAACGTPIISDPWPGLDQFFEPGREILVATSSDEVLGYLRSLPEEVRLNTAEKAREKVRSAHSNAQRARELCLELEAVLRRQSALA